MSTTDETRSAIVAELRYMAERFTKEAEQSYGGASDAYSSAAYDLTERAKAWENGQEWAEQRAELAAKLTEAEAALREFDATHQMTEAPNA